VRVAVDGVHEDALLDDLVVEAGADGGDGGGEAGGAGPDDEEIAYPFDGDMLAARAGERPC